MPVEVRRNVERLAVGERTGRIERHVAADELGSGADARHARPEIVGLRPPNRRGDGGALPRHAVALGAGRGKHARAGGGIRGERRPLLQPRATPCRGPRDRRALREKREVREDVAHIGSSRVDRRAVHAAAKAVVHAILDGLDGTAAGAVLRITREHADPRAILAPPGVQMTARTAQLVAYVVREAVVRHRENRTPSSYGCPKRASRYEGVGRAARRRRGRWRLDPSAGGVHTDANENQAKTWAHPARQYRQFPRRQPFAHSSYPNLRILHPGFPCSHRCSPSCSSPKTVLPSTPPLLRGC